VEPLEGRRYASGAERVRAIAKTADGAGPAFDKNPQLGARRRPPKMHGGRGMKNWNSRVIGLAGALMLSLTLAALPARAQAASAALATKGDRKPIDVVVSAGAVSVPEDPAHTTTNEIALVWVIQDEGYVFAPNGVVAEAGHLGRCKVFANGRGIRCVKLRKEQGTRYKYSVNLLDRASGKPLPTLDPFLQND
jgi:hypothetical protein